VFRSLCASLFLALALVLPAHAQQANQPLELVRSFYAPDFDEQRMPLSNRLQKLLDAAIDNSRKHDMPVSGLDFSWILNAQDAEPDFDKTLKFSETEHKKTSALIRVTFHNGRDEELLYEMKQESGRWVVDDIRYLKGQPTRLSDMLRAGAQEKP